jgi:hypothetical protein
MKNIGRGDKDRLGKKATAPRVHATKLSFDRILQSRKMKPVTFWVSFIAATIGIVAGIIGIGTFLGKMLPEMSLFAGWNFKIVQVELNNNIVNTGDDVVIRVIVKNTGARAVGTCYGVIKIAYAYDHGNPVLDTNRDLPLYEKSKLRVVDIIQGYTKEFTFTWHVPSDLAIGVYDVAVEIWSPPLLYQASGERCFDKTDWDKHIEVRQH